MQKPDTRALREQRALSANPTEGRNGVFQGMLPTPSVSARNLLWSRLPPQTQGDAGMDTKGLFPQENPSPSPGTCTMVSRFCRDVETELMTEEGPMVTTLMWWEGGGGAGTITVGWWVGAGGGRSCKTEALSLFSRSCPFPSVAHRGTALKTICSERASASHPSP